MYKTTARRVKTAFIVFVRYAETRGEDQNRGMGGAEGVGYVEGGLPSRHVTTALREHLELPEQLRGCQRFWYILEVKEEG